MTTSAASPGARAVTIEFDPAREPIEGWLRGGDGVRRPFAGWLGLLGALDSAIAGDRDAAPERR
jgi:hypothetical protein